MQNQCIHVRMALPPTAVAVAMERLFGWFTGSRPEEEEREKDTSSINSRERGDWKGICTQCLRSSGNPINLIHQKLELKWSCMSFEAELVVYCEPCQL